MRKILFGLIFIYGTAYSQNVVLDLDNSLNPANYFARDEVNLLPGVTALPSSNSDVFKFYIDRSIQISSTYESSVNYIPSTSPINTNLIVGALEGASSVNLSGQASYVIGISLPPGTNKVSPEINIIYNSNSPDGILGRGWSISGLSNITRVSRDYYHDCGKSQIKLNDGSANLNENDVFALDGNRIIGTQLESDNFSFVNFKISDDYFEVSSKDGLVMEYGNTSDSKLRLLKPGTSIQKTLTYFLNKVTDRFGNYIEYEYYNSNGEVTIKSIRYTGNLTANITPYNEINFYYDIRKDQAKRYLLGNLIPSTLILREVEIKCEGQKVNDYQFSYGVNSQSYLNKITQVSLTNTELNSTEFLYGENVTSPNRVSFTKPITTGSYNEIMKSAEYRVGDFNGDGKSDLLAFEYNTIDQYIGQCDFTGVWKLYLNTSVSNVDGVYFTEISMPSLPSTFYPYPLFIYAGEFSPYPVGFQVSDFNKDGLDDIVLANSQSGATTYTVYKSNGAGFDVGNSFTTSRGFILADVDGDGVPEGIENNMSLALPSLKIVWIETGASAFVTIFKDPSNNLLPLGDQYDGFTPIDFDGDGIQELVSKRRNHSVVLKFTILCAGSCGNSSKEIFSESIGAAYYQNNYADFNGDGITDVIKICEPYASGSHEAKLRFGTGVDYTSVENLPGTAAYYFNRTYLTGDINNNGKYDLIEIKNETTSGQSVDFKCSFDGNSGEASTLIGGLSGTEFPPVVDHNYHSTDNLYNPYLPDYRFGYPVPNLKPEFLFGDFDGDGRQDIFFKTVNGPTGSGTRQIAYFNSKSTQHLLTQVDDGFKNTVKFEYATITNGGTDLYQKNTGSTFPILDIASPIYVVKSMSKSNAIGGFNVFNYKYEGASVHLNGKGFLGFDKMSIIDNVMQLKTENIFSIDAKYCEKNLSERKVFKLSNLTTPIFVENYNYNFDPPVASVSDCYGTIFSKAKSHFLKTDNISSTDFITGKSVITNNYYGSGNDRGNIVRNTVQTVGQEEVETLTSYTHAGTYGSINNIPQTVITTVSKLPNNPYVRRVDYNYDASTGQMNTTIVDFGTSNEVVADFQYDLTGNVTQKQISSAGLPTSTDKFEYDIPKRRFIIKEYNALNQVSENEYDPKWGVPTKIKDINGLTTRLLYDNLGRLSKIFGPDNSMTKLEFNWEVGNSFNFNDPLGVSNKILYSETKTVNGRPRSKEYYDLFGRTLVSEIEVMADIIYTQTQFDERENVFKQVLGYTDTSVPLITTNQFTDADGPNLLANSLVTDGTESKITYYNYSYPGGNKKVSITNPDNSIEYKTYDANGKLILAEDDGGQIAYEYFNNSMLKSISVGGVLSNSMTYDPFANQTSLYDKDAGSTTYHYNAYGLLDYQEDANGNKTDNLVYNEISQMISKRMSNTNTSEVLNYSYQFSNGSSVALNKLKEVQVTSSGSNHKINYTYDTFGKLNSYNELIDGVNLLTSYEYDNNDNLIKTILPGGFTLTRDYDSKGYLKRIKNGSIALWEADEMTSFGKYSKYTLGNGIQTQIDYNNFGFPVRISASGVQDSRFDFDITNSNLISRKDYSFSRNLTEEFQYDPMRQLNLTHVTTPVSLPSYATVYNDGGTISEKQDAGNYSLYNLTHLDAVENISTLQGNIGSDRQDIIYSLFNKPLNIYEGFNNLNISYGTNQERIKEELLNQGALVSKKIFYPGLERLTIGSVTTDIYYINSPTGICAIYTVTNGVGQMHYVYQDYLGSIIKITNSYGVVEAEQSFDAWGRQRNPNDWTFVNIPSTPDWLYRGFTGHENLAEFGLINMNGRMYDPVLGTMLSPDKYVQYSGSSNGFNRYAYCLNNPLSSVDQNGNFLIVPLLIYALAGGTTSWMLHGCQFNAKGLGYFGIGALAGVVSAGVAGGINASIVGNSSGGFWAGALGSAQKIGTGFSSGFVSGFGAGLGAGFISGFGSGLIERKSFNESLMQGLDESWKGALIAGALGGIAGGVYAKKHEQNFWTGADKQKVTFKVYNSKSIAIGAIHDYEAGKSFKGDDYTTTLGLNNSTFSIDKDGVVTTTLKIPNELNGVNGAYSPSGIPITEFNFSNNTITLKSYERLTNIQFYGWRYESNPVVRLRDLFHSR